MLRTFPHDRLEQEAPGDRLSARLNQSVGILNAVQNTWDDESVSYLSPIEYVREALFGVINLLDEARRAAADERGAAMPAPKKAVGATEKTPARATGGKRRGRVLKRGRAAADNSIPAATKHKASRGVRHPMREERN